MIGYILFHQQEKDIYEIGWFFNKAYWWQGYAYESCKAVMDYTFNELKAKKIFAESMDLVKSVSLMKKLGMEIEGIEPIQTGDISKKQANLYVYCLHNKHTCKFSPSEK